MFPYVTHSTLHKILHFSSAAADRRWRMTSLADNCIWDASKNGLIRTARLTTRVGTGSDEWISVVFGYIVYCVSSRSSCGSVMNVSTFRLHPPTNICIKELPPSFSGKHASRLRIWLPSISVSPHSWEKSRWHFNMEVISAPFYEKRRLLSCANFNNSFPTLYWTLHEWVAFSHTIHR